MPLTNLHCLICFKMSKIHPSKIFALSVTFKHNLAFS